MIPRLGLICVAMLSPLVVSAQAAETQTLSGPEAFQHIKNKEERSKALFTEMGKVIESPRCMNCHPRGDSPTQKDGEPHMPPVVRGPMGAGRQRWSAAPAMARSQSTSPMGLAVCRGTQTGISPPFRWAGKVCLSATSACRCWTRSAMVVSIRQS